MGIVIGSLQSEDINMYKLAITLVCLIGFSQATPTREVRTKTKDLLCDICVDVVTDLDNWITSDSTMDEIIDFVENLCSLFGAIDPALETLCDTLIESQLPEIINGLVNDNLNPQEVCQNIGACSKPSTTPAPAPTGKH